MMLSLALRLTLTPLLLLPLVAQGAEIAGVRLPDIAHVGGHELRLNGGGLRQKAFFRIYVAALYLPSRQSSAADVLATPGAKRLSMVMLRDVTAQQLIAALTEGIRDNHSPAEAGKLQPRVEMLSKVMTSIGSARSGSVITLDFVPGAGMQGGLDGASIGTPIPGDDFYRALLKIWLGEPPVDEALKKALLGSS
jgi:hypothetical protein